VDHKLLSLFCLHHINHKVSILTLPKLMIAAAGQVHINNYNYNNRLCILFGITPYTDKTCYVSLWVLNFVMCFDC